MRRQMRCFNRGLKTYSPIDEVLYTNFTFDFVPSVLPAKLSYDFAISDIAFSLADNSPNLPLNSSTIFEHLPY